GKLYHYDVPGGIGTNGKDDSLSWDQVVNPKGFDTRVEHKLINRTPGSRHLGGAMAYYIDSSHKEKHTDELVADEVVKLMASHKNGPFFIGAGFFRPHCPYIAPKEYFDLY